MTSSKKEIILLVEDEPVTAKLQADFLTTFGYEVILAISGEIAVDLVAQNKNIDLILMDIDLGQGIDGTVAAKQILAIRDLPVVFLTSHSEGKMVEKVRGLTRYGFLIKNSSNFILQSSIEMAFELFQARQAMASKMEAVLETENRYRDLFEKAGDGISILSPNGQLVDVNESFARMHGYSSQEMKQMSLKDLDTPETSLLVPERMRRLLAGESLTFEVEHYHRDGHIFPLEVSANLLSSGGESYIQCFHRDITERKFLEDKRELTARLLVMVNSPGSFRECLSNLTVFLKARSGCEAAGIRLRSGEDFPYYETRGFPTEFVLAENSLCALGPNGKNLRDGEGRLVLECMCGSILGGRIDHTKPCFTDQGSFWSNNTSVLFAGTTQADCMSRPRNRCTGKGYESVALIPLRTGHQIFGLLQFNDHRPNRFTPALIAHFESMADSLAIVLSRRQADEALRESEFELREAQRLANIGSWTYDLVSRQSHWSEGMFQIWNLDPKLGPPHYSEHSKDVHPDDVRRFDTAVKESLQSGKPYELELRILLPGGAQKTIITTCEPQCDATGKVVKLRGTIQDITPRKRVIEALQESENRYRRITEGITDYLYTVRISNGIAVETKHGVTCEKVTGYTPDDFAANHYLWITMIPAEEQKGVATHVEEILAGKEIPPIEHHIRCKDGELRWVSDTIILQKDVDGKLLSYDGVVKDLTERKKAERALCQSEEKFSRAFQTAPYAISITSLEDGRFVEVNDGFTSLTGFTREEALAKSTIALKLWAQDEDRKRVVTAIRQGLAVVGQEYLFRTKSGKIVTGLYSAQAIQLSQGPCVLSSINDITDGKLAEENLRQMEARLRQSEKMEAIGQLAGGIAHDFNNVLGGIIGFTEMSFEFAGKDSVLEKNLRQVLKAADRAKNLVRQILTFSRQNKPQKLVGSIQPVIEEVLALLRASVPSSVLIEADLHNEAKPVLADPTEIHEMLLNLVTNAVHAMNSQGTLTIRLYDACLGQAEKSLAGEIAPGQYTTIEVADSGCGMDVRTLSKAFEPFFTTKAVGEGTGMGLRSRA